MVHQYVLYELYRKLCLYDEIIIYGAGTYGQLFLRQMYNIGLYKKYIFAVTVKGDEKCCMGHEIRTIAHALRDMSSSALVVVAVGKELRESLVENLTQKKGIDYLVLDDEILVALKQQEIFWGKQQEKSKQIESCLKNNFRKNEQLCPAVSVLVPVCNVQKYVTQCIESLLQQSMYNLEIIALDDGSTDNSASILDELSKQDERLRVIHKKNSGYGDTMNWGIALARGEYVAILESDDYAEKDMIYFLYSAAVLKNAELVIADYYVDQVHADGKLEKIIKAETLQEINYWEYLSEEQRKKLAYATPGIWRCLYKKSFLEKMNINFLITHGASYQDTSFYVKAVMMAQKTVCIRDRIMHYRRGHSAASVMNTDKVYAVCGELQEIRRYMQEHNMKSWYGSYGLLLFIKYLWNFQRLEKTQKTEFLNYFKCELEEADRTGWNDQDIWPEWKRMQRDRLFGGKSDESR